MSEDKSQNAVEGGYTGKHQPMTIQEEESPAKGQKTKAVEEEVGSAYETAGTFVNVRGYSTRDSKSLKQRTRRSGKKTSAVTMKKVLGETSRALKLQRF